MEPMYIVGITGASGPIIGIRLIEELVRRGLRVASIVSSAAAPIIRYEVPGAESYDGLKKLLASRDPGLPLDGLSEYADDDLWAPPSSGSNRSSGLIIAPCSMKTLAAVASGYAGSLIHRAADVALKEGRPCVLVPRETPLSLIHLENMVRVKRAGAHVLPPVPGFYLKPRSIDEVCDFVVGKVLSLLGIEHELIKPWNGSIPPVPRRGDEE